MAKCMYDILLSTLLSSKSASSTQHTRGNDRKTGRVRTFSPALWLSGRKSRYLAYMVAVKATILHRHEKRIDPTIRGSMGVRILEILFDDLAAEPQGQGECMYDILLSSKSASSTQHTRGNDRKTAGRVRTFSPALWLSGRKSRYLAYTKTSVHCHGSPSGSAVKGNEHHGPCKAKAK